MLFFYAMHPLVRDLYRRFMIAGRDYPHPGGLQHVRKRVKAAFRAEVVPAGDAAALSKAVHKGRWWVRELHGVAALKKYRAMRARYGDSGAGAADASALEAKLAALEAAAAAPGSSVPPPPR